MSNKQEITSKKAKVTDVHRAEAALLRAIWDTKKHGSQAEFGETYGIGNQSAVGQFLRGDAALSLKAARGFALGLGCEIGDFSKRLEAEAKASLGLAGLSREIFRPSTPEEAQRMQEVVNYEKNNIRQPLEHLAKAISLMEPSSRQGLAPLFAALTIGPDSKETLEAIAIQIENAPTRDRKVQVEKSKHRKPENNSEVNRAA